ncbi:hypothetical protein LOCC1_G006053 [Lachnellula occidentalis]|uniref:DUF6594 domain-containing protein n=1 Tax=Lachnellula occidentalis TaxID=215460 RepID=A0A8H8UC38_9HELO|nr:hypothetical protein LOCC1_G006053 [Lachnellula occidentalis]
MLEMEMSPEGYPRLAALQGTYPQLGIYRRFAILNARNLLYLQAELVDLESSLNEYTKEDGESEDSRIRLHNKNWFYLGRKNDGVLGSQWHTMIRLRKKLKQYNQCLFQQRQLATFDQPEAGNLEFINEWLADSRQGNYALEGLDRNVWKDGKDLLVVPPDTLVGDSFTRILRKPLTTLYHKVWGRRRGRTDVEGGICVYREKIVIRSADMIGTAVASLLPVLAVVALYCVREMLTRLGMVALFTVLFSMALVVTTSAKRMEVFAATAAFASVQVVFVGSTTI